MENHFKGISHGYLCSYRNFGGGMAHFFRLIVLFLCLFSSSISSALTPVTVTWYGVNGFGGPDRGSNWTLLATTVPGACTAWGGAGTSVNSGYCRLAGGWQQTWFAYNLPNQCPSNSTLSGSSCTCNSGFEEDASHTSCVPVCPAGKTRNPVTGLCESGCESLVGGAPYNFNFTLGWVKEGSSYSGAFPSTTCENTAAFGGCTYSLTLDSALPTGSPINGFRLWKGDFVGVPNGASCTVTPPRPDPAPPPCVGQSGTVNGLTVCMPEESSAQKEARAQEAARQAAATAAAAARNAALSSGASPALAEAAAKAAGEAAASTALSTVRNGGSSASSAAAGAAAGKAAGEATKAASDAGKSPAETKAAADNAAQSAAAGKAAADAAAEAGAPPEAASAAGSAAAAAASKAAADAVAAAIAAGKTAGDAAKAGADAAAAAGKAAGEAAAAAGAAAAAAGKTAAEAAAAAAAAGKAAGDAAAAAAAAGAGKGGNGSDPISDYCEKNPTSKLCKSEDDSSFSGTCGAPPTCTGDAVMCAVAAATFQTNCALKLADQDTAEMLAYAEAKTKTGDQTTDLENPPEIDVGPGGFDQSDMIGGGSGGMTDLTVTVVGKSVTLPFSSINIWLERLGYLLQAVTFFTCAYIVTGNKQGGSA